MIVKGAQKLEEFIAKNGIKHFRAEEFVCKHCKEVYIDSFLVEVVEQIRRELGRPVVITSAYRCPEYNAAIGGVKNSAHTRGYALDIKCFTSKGRAELVSLLFDLGVDRVGIAQSFVHFDVDPDKPSPRLWLYGRRKHVG